MLDLRGRDNVSMFCNSLCAPPSFLLADLGRPLQTKPNMSIRPPLGCSLTSSPHWSKDMLAPVCNVPNTPIHNKGSMGVDMKGILGFMP